MNQYTNEDGLTTTTTSTTTTTTVTTTTSRSRQPSPNSAARVPESDYASEQSSSTTPSIPPPPPQQRLSGPDKLSPPSNIHPALRSLPPHEVRQAEEQSRRDGYKGKDPLVTIRESRALSDKASISSRATSADPHTRGSMLGDFKAATAGLYDVRDSVRSMVSAEQTRYYARKPTSAKDLKNQGSAPQIRDPPPRPDWSGSEPPSDGSVMGDRQPSQQLNYSSSNSTMGQGAEGDRSRRKSLGSVPATFSPESTGTAQDEHVGTLRRLLKGRH